MVRENLLTDPTYAPYCLNCSSMARMQFTGIQFKCMKCKKETNFEKSFIEQVIDFRRNYDKV